MKTEYILKHKEAYTLIHKVAALSLNDLLVNHRRKIAANERNQMLMT